MELEHSLIGMHFRQLLGQQRASSDFIWSNFWSCSKYCTYVSGAAWFVDTCIPLGCLAFQPLFDVALRGLQFFN